MDLVSKLDHLPPELPQPQPELKKCSCFITPDFSYPNLMVSTGELPKLVMRL